jgi:CheY-like chemotaxis protein
MKIKGPKYRFENVMLIDDSELDNFINEKMVAANHFSKRVYVHTSAKSALESISNLALVSEKTPEILPEVIFIDLNMPVMDGFQFISQFKSDYEQALHQPKLVILTSSVSKDDQQKARSISPDILFLNKPLTEKLLEKI